MGGLSDGQRHRNSGRVHDITWHGRMLMIEVYMSIMTEDMSFAAACMQL